MNKNINKMKYIFLLIGLILTISFIIQNGIGNFGMVIYYIFFIIVTYISYKDIRNKRISSKNYNIMFILVMSIISFLLLRTFLDKNLLFNSEIYNSIIDFYGYSFGVCELRIQFFSQNIYYLSFMFLSLIVLRQIDDFKEFKRISNYSKLSIICLITNVVLSFETMMLFTQYIEKPSFPLLFFTINTILLVTEIVSLIKYNGKKREWPIYICFLYNLFAYISMFIQLV